MDVFIGTPPGTSPSSSTPAATSTGSSAPLPRLLPPARTLYDPNLSSTYRNLTCRDHSCALVSPPPPDTTTHPIPMRPRRRPRPHLPILLLVRRPVQHHRRPRGRGLHRQPHRRQFAPAGRRVVFGRPLEPRPVRGGRRLLGLGGARCRSPRSCAPSTATTLLLLLTASSTGTATPPRDQQARLRRRRRRRPSRHELHLLRRRRKDNHPGHTFYVRVKGVRVGGEPLPVPPESWELAEDGTGGTIIDSGTTLTYFVRPAYRAIREAFARKVTYPLVEDFPVLNPCYNVSGVAGEEVVMPGFGLEFADGAVWDFPAENYFIRLEPEAIMCLAFLETPRSSLSIIGNYQQQNFRILYDNKRSRGVRPDQVLRSLRAAMLPVCGPALRHVSRLHWQVNGPLNIEETNGVRHATDGQPTLRQVSFFQKFNVC
ncbi:uncharacterized protein M6B38_116880 [Iris pallida]|uniref:Xylanase inhibitor C-terminal domain-containing protein n=1 Tax=Iris pallida TaxID=29817 RepID=A0AAX6HTQ4_IRIPA|nr:uncharacterized protein M6B38_116880 [Iris pallida]